MSQRKKLFRTVIVLCIGLICIIGIGYFAPSLWLNATTRAEQEYFVNNISRNKLPPEKGAIVLPDYDKHLSQMIAETIRFYTGLDDIRVVVRSDLKVRREHIVNKEILPDTQVVKTETTEHKDDKIVVQNKVYDYSTRVTTSQIVYYDIQKMNILVFMPAFDLSSDGEDMKADREKSFELVRNAIGFDAERGDTFQTVQMPRVMEQSGLFGIYDVQIRQIMAIVLICVLCLLIFSGLVVPYIMGRIRKAHTLAGMVSEPVRDSYRYQIIGNLEENLTFKAQELCRLMPEAAVNILRNRLAQESSSPKTNDVFSPAQKAAIVLLCIGEQGIRRLFKYMTETEIYSLSRIMASLGQVKAVDIQPVLSAFCQSMTAPQDIRQTKPLVESLVRNTLPVDKANALLKEMNIVATSKTVWEKMAQVPSGHLSAFLSAEYPQTAAVILYHLNTEKAAEILMEMENNIGAQILLRLSSLQYLSPEKVRSIEIGLEKQIEMLMEKPCGVGERKASAILSLLDRKTQNRYISSMEQVAPQTAGALAKQVLAFDDLARWSGEDLAVLLKHIDTQTLVIALSNAKSTTKEAFSRIMSPQKWGDVLKKINRLPTGKVNDIDISQRAVIQIAQQLIESKKCKGTIV